MQRTGLLAAFGCAGLVALGMACDDPPHKAPSGKSTGTREAGKTSQALDDLGMRMSARHGKARIVELTEEQNKKVADAARVFAEAVSRGDRARYTKIYLDALKVAHAAEIGEPASHRFRGHGGHRAAPPSSERDPAQSILADPRYTANAATLLADDEERPLLRIVGGVQTSSFKDCFAVGDAEGYCCTGTLIGTNVVLTAGHCFPCVAEGNGGQVFTGPIVGGMGQTIKVKKAIQHPDYNRGGKHNDLTLLILEEHVTGIDPRTVAKPADIDAAAYVRAVGYGNTDNDGTTGYGKRRMANIPIVSPGCAGTDHTATYGCDANELVAGLINLNRDTCTGDSGGPVYIKVSGKWMLAGATSRASRNSNQACGDGGIYARVDRYMDWIRQTAQANGGVLPAE